MEWRLADVTVLQAKVRGGGTLVKFAREVCESVTKIIKKID